MQLRGTSGLRSEVDGVERLQIAVDAARAATGAGTAVSMVGAADQLVGWTLLRRAPRDAICRAGAVARLLRTAEP